MPRVLVKLESEGHLVNPVAVGFAMDGAWELLASGSDWFWNERRWLPPNVTWSELEDLANKHPNNYRYGLVTANSVPCYLQIRNHRPLSLR